MTIIEDISAVPNVYPAHNELAPIDKIAGWTVPDVKEVIVLVGTAANGVIVEAVVKAKTEYLEKEVATVLALWNHPPLIARED